MGMSGVSLHSKRPSSDREGAGERKKKKSKGQMCVCVDSEETSVSAESLLVRETAIIGDTHKSVESIGDMKRVTRLTDGAIKMTFRESCASLLSSCTAVNVLHGRLMFVHKPSNSWF